MTIRFAAARRKECGPVARVLAASVPLHPGNDNGWSLTDDPLLVASLRHFADHGLGAAEAARQNAQDALVGGDSKGHEHWLAVCGALDRRLASRHRQHKG